MGVRKCGLELILRKSWSVFVVENEGEKKSK
jgi:hypothetical protein